MQDSKTMLAMCEEQEEKFQFDHFSRADALALGLKLNENAGKQPIPVAIEITVNGLTVFRYFPDGAMPDSELWLQRKRRTVDLMHMSSLRFLAWLEENGETMDVTGEIASLTVQFDAASIRELTGGEAALCLLVPGDGEPAQATTAAQLVEAPQRR